MCAACSLGHLDHDCLPGSIFVVVLQCAVGYLLLQKENIFRTLVSGWCEIPQINKPLDTSFCNMTLLPGVPRSNVLWCAPCHRCQQNPSAADSCRRRSGPRWLRLGSTGPAAAPSGSAAGCRRIAGSHTHTHRLEVKMGSRPGRWLR